MCELSAHTSHPLTSGGKPDHSENGKTGVRYRRSGIAISPSTAVGSDVIAHVQAAQSKVPREDRGVLPSSAWVDLHTTEDRRVPVRALVDQCSTLSFISESETLSDAAD
jgi:hypothetical protein